jgi:NAD(P)-dependent dehydrogenase (short-subunit alcohol dehydrogenase family)
MRDFRGRVAAITGAGSGMGRALALELAARGCAVAIADVVPAGLDETDRLLAERGAARSTHVVDVADRRAVEAFAADAAREHGCVNLLFNNAGVSVTNSAERLSYADFEWLMNINFWGVVHGTKAFLPYLRQVDAAHIVNTSSIFGVIAVPSQSAYNASKFAVRGFTEALRQELADTHIGVSCVLPRRCQNQRRQDFTLLPERQHRADQGRDGRTVRAHRGVVAGPGGDPDSGWRNPQSQSHSHRSRCAPAGAARTAVPADVRQQARAPRTPARTGQTVHLKARISTCACHTS